MGATRGRMAETIQEGGCRGMQEAMEVGEPPEGGGPMQCRRAEVEGCRRAWKQGSHQREVRDNTGGRMYRDAGGHGGRGATRGRKADTIQEGGGRGMQEGMEVGEPPER